MDLDWCAMICVAEWVFSISLQKCHVKKKDIRKFLDGIYVSDKGVIEEEQWASDKVAKMPGDDPEVLHLPAMLLLSFGLQFSRDWILYLVRMCYGACYLILHIVVSV